MVLKPAAMTSDVASGPDAKYTREQASGSDFCFTQSVTVETLQIDLAMSTEISGYEDDVAFVNKQTEKQRRKNANYRYNLGLRTYEAWERIYMAREDVNTWLNIPQDGPRFFPRNESEQSLPSQEASAPVCSLRQHILRVAAQFEQQWQQQCQVLNSSLPKTPEELKDGTNRSKSPLNVGSEEPAPKRARTSSWVHCEDFVMDQYKTPLLQDPYQATEVERKHPQPRAACYDRRTPRLVRVPQNSPLKPPYGIDLIQEWRKHPLATK